MQTSSAQASPRAVFTELVDLANEKLGGQALAASDEFFAPKESLTKAVEPVFLADKYTEFGKWMDGWESRRKRGVDHLSHDWCVLKLGVPGVIHGVNVDTAYFTGNFPEYCAIDALEAKGAQTTEALVASKSWKEILPKCALAGGTANLFSISSRERFTHLRLRIFPDGGVARLRVHGVVAPDWAALKGQASVDLAAIENGGSVVGSSDAYFGPKENLIYPGRAAVMGEGWETRRRRGPGYDWILVRLGATGRLLKLEVDTNHFKGNYPESCSIDACFLPGEKLLPVDFRERKDIVWKEVLPRTKLQAHTRHFFEKELQETSEKFNYVRLNIYPDGGVSRLRVYGVVVE